MDMFIVHGGRRLQGRVRVGGAKNAALPIMAAAILTDGVNQICNVPQLVDVRTLAHLLTTLGVRCESVADGCWQLQTVDESPFTAAYDLVRRMRASVCVLGPLLAKRKRACVSLPGGCAIGDRPIDLHLKGLQALGANIRVENGYVHATAERLRGCRVFLGGPFGSTVLGTCNVMSAATLAEGTTIIEAAACEPEVVDLGQFLIRCGADIAGLGTPTIRIDGVPALQATDYQVIPDRIEAATLMIATAVTRGDVLLEHVQPEHLTAVIETLRSCGVSVSIEGTQESPAIRVQLDCRPQSTDVTALPYPGLPTDVQAQFMALLALAEGSSVVTDKVFPDRFLHAPELVRLGARIRREGASAIITGGPALSGACVMASDLRASAALVIAALAATGASEIRRIYHLDRGYDHLENKLTALGANVVRCKDDPTTRNHN